MYQDHMPSLLKLIRLPATLSAAKACGVDCIAQPTKIPIAKVIPSLRHKARCIMRSASTNKVLCRNWRGAISAYHRRKAQTRQARDALSRTNTREVAGFIVAISLYCVIELGCLSISFPDQGTYLPDPDISALALAELSSR